MTFYGDKTRKIFRLWFLYIFTHVLIKLLKKQLSFSFFNDHDLLELDRKGRFYMPSILVKKLSQLVSRKYLE